METKPLTLETLLPVIAAIGFAVQQFLQVVADPIVSIIITVLKGKSSESQPSAAALPWGISDVDAKKALLGVVSIALGLLIAASAPDIRVLKAAGELLPGGLNLSGWDLFITALTISAGTEGVNSVVKIIQYLKDAVKKKTPASVEQQSPVPQAPAVPLSPEFVADLNNPNLVDIDATEKSLDVKSRAKEEDYAA